MNAVLQEPAVREIPRAAIHDALMLPVGLLRPNPWNRQVNERRVAEMADSVVKYGVLQPVLVRPIDGAKAGEPLYELIAGEHRWRASQAAGKAEIPALVRAMDDLEVIELSLIENLQREGLHELDEAAGYDRLLRKDHGPQSLRGFASVEALAERLGKSKSYVVQRLTLLKLCPEGVKAFRAGEIGFSLALRIARLPEAQDQAKATAAILQGWGGQPLTAREADAYIHREFMLELDRARFKITDATLVPEAGSCRDCSKRTGANADLFDDIKAKDTCTDGACFKRKEQAHAERTRAEAEARGVQVIAGAAAKKILPNTYSQPKGYLELDKKHYQISADKPLRKLLAKADVKPVMVESPHTGELVEMVPQDQAMAALKAAGVIKQAKMPSTSASQRDTDARNKRETAWRTAVAEDILAAARGEPGASEAYRALLVQRVATVLWHKQPHDTRVRLAKLLGWPPLKSRHESGPGLTADQHIGSLDAGELCRYLTACIIVGDTYIAGYQGPTKPEQLLTMATLLGVDVQAAKDRVRQLSKATPDKVAAKRAVKNAAKLDTPESALAAALKKETAAKRASGLSAPKGTVKYRDPATGSTWSGRGLRPAWLRAAIAGGASLESFELSASDAKAPPPFISEAGALRGLPQGDE